MLNAKLKKQIEFYRGKCWEYHNRMKFADCLTITKYEQQYNKYNTKYHETQKIIESDGKHKVIFGTNNQIKIEEIK
jgi:hypothetical protein